MPFTKNGFFSSEWSSLEVVVALLKQISWFDGCQMWGMEVGKMDEEDQKVKTSIYWMIKSWGYNVQHGDYG